MCSISRDNVRGAPGISVPVEDARLDGRLGLPGSGKFQDRGVMASMMRKLFARSRIHGCMRFRLSRLCDGDRASEVVVEAACASLYDNSL